MREDLKTRAIVLSRINYGESDRIMTILTEEYGKVRLIVKGVRKQKSKLASSVELFSISNIVFRYGKNDIGRLINANLEVFYDNILNNIDRVTVGYDLLKLLNKYTEDKIDKEYFLLITTALQSLNNDQINLKIIIGWFYGQFLILSGQQPNLSTTKDGLKLDPDLNYGFSFDDLRFYVSDASDVLSANHVKYLRLLFSVSDPLILQKVQGSNEFIDKVFFVIETMFSEYIRV